jgi:hypothetical protein
MTTRALIVIASLLAAATAGLAGYIAGSDAKPSRAEVDAARHSARASASHAAFEQARTVALTQGRRSGEKEGRVEGRGRGKAAARRRMAKEAVVGSSQPATPPISSRLKHDPAFEDDGGAYDPNPPPYGSYASKAEFCRDQPEETECGGAGDPYAP